MSNGKKIVIIGCGAAGGTAAQFARKTDRKAEIIIFEKDKYPQYSKCGLPYTISEIIPKKTDLIEFPKDWFKNANIELFLDTTVEKIDIKKGIVLANKGNEKIEKKYDSLIICTGANPIFPPIKNLYENGRIIKGVFAVRTIDDALNISSYIKKDGNATIVGAGLIGLEMADNISKKKMNVSVVEALPNILANTLDEDISKIIFEKISQHVKIFTNHLATKINNKNGKISKICIKNRETDEEKEIETDLLIVAVGAKPNISLAKNIGCKIGETKGIIVNDKSETIVKNVYSAGDCTEYIDFITNKPVLIGLGSIAVRQAISAGINAAGGSYNFLNGVLLSRTSEFFNLEIAGVGPINKNLSDFSTVSGRFNGFSRPDYFPGGKPITIKVTVNQKDGRILAAQAVGENAAQRINTFSTAILGHLDVETFKKLETAYAPPIAPTLDVVTIVCDIVSKKLKQKK